MQVPFFCTLAASWREYWTSHPMAKPKGGFPSKNNEVTRVVVVTKPNEITCVAVLLIVVGAMAGRALGKWCQFVGNDADDLRK